MSQHPLAFWSLSTTDILRQLQMAKAFAYHKQEAYTIAQRLSCIAGTIPTRRIGIIGSGKMGAGLGRLWAKHGHYAMFSYSRRPEKLQDLVREIGSHARSGSTEDAVRYGNVVLLAVPWAAIGDALSDAGPLNRKILISCVNPFGARGLEVGLTTSAAEEISKLTPDAAVVEAFNTVFASILHSGAHLLVRQRGKGAQLHSPLSCISCTIPHHT